MKYFYKSLLPYILFLVTAPASIMMAQSYEEGHGTIISHGDHWMVTQNEYGRYQWGHDADGDGHWEWYDHEPTPWPPDYYGDDGSLDGDIDNDNLDDYADDDANWWEYDQDQDGDWYDDWWENIWDGYWDYFGGQNPNPSACPSLDHLTMAPPNEFTRTKVGIGEDFSVSVKNFSSCTNVNWEVVNEPNTGADPPECILDGASTADHFAWFKAGFKPGRVTIKARITGCVSCPDPTNLEVEFEIIQPTGVYFEPIAPCSEGPVLHDHNYPSAGYVANIYLMPDDVNFYNVETKELGTSNAGNGEVSLGGTTCDGPYYASSNMSCSGHPAATSWIPFTNTVVPGKGTKTMATDRIYMLLRCKNNADATLAGYKLWEIGWVYRRGTDEVPFSIVEQRGENFGGPNSKFQTSKGNSNKAASLSDPSVCGTPQIPSCPD